MPSKRSPSPKATKRRTTASAKPTLKKRAQSASSSSKSRVASSSPKPARRSRRLSVKISGSTSPRRSASPVPLVRSPVVARRGSLLELVNPKTAKFSETVWTAVIFISYVITTFQFALWIPYKAFALSMEWPALMGGTCFQKCVNLWKNHLITFPPNQFFKINLGLDWKAQAGVSGLLAFGLGMLAFMPRPWPRVAGLAMIAYTLYHLTAVLFVYDHAGVAPMTCFTQNKVLDKVVTVFGFLLIAQASAVVALKDVSVCRAFKETITFFNGPNGLLKCRWCTQGTTGYNWACVGKLTVVAVIVADIALFIHIALSMLTQDRPGKA